MHSETTHVCKVFLGWHQSSGHQPRPGPAAPAWNVKQPIVRSWSHVNPTTNPTTNPTCSLDHALRKHWRALYKLLFRHRICKNIRQSVLSEQEIFTTAKIMQQQRLYASCQLQQRLQQQTKRAQAPATTHPPPLRGPCTTEPRLSFFIPSLLRLTKDGGAGVVIPKSVKQQFFGTKQGWWLGILAFWLFPTAPENHVS